MTSLPTSVETYNNAFKGSLAKRVRLYANVRRRDEFAFRIAGHDRRSSNRRCVGSVSLPDVL